MENVKETLFATKNGMCELTKKVLNDIKNDLSNQYDELSKMELTENDFNDIIFGENDILDKYISDNGLNEDDFNKNLIRDVQHDMIDKLIKQQERDKKC